MKDVTARLIEELLQHFVSEKYTIIGARDSTGYRLPDALHNDGYGDQKNKRPDVLAFDEINKRFVIGVVKAPRRGPRITPLPHSIRCFLRPQECSKRKTVAGLLSSSAGF